MTTTAEQTKIRTFTVELLPDAAAPWEVIVAPTGEYPMAPGDAERLNGFVDAALDHLCRPEDLQEETFIQLAQAHHEDGPARISGNGRTWLPSIGLGVWPDREPPKLWTEDDFKGLDAGEQVRTLMYQTLRVTGEAEARAHARRTMLGLGCALTFGLPPAAADGFKERRRAELLTPITDTTFTCFPEYVPLLEAKSFRDTPLETLDRWMCGAAVYVRESAEDNGLLIAARQPLAPVLQALGAKAAESPGAAKWSLPI